MRKYLSGVIAILVSFSLLAFLNPSTPPGNCDPSKSYIWYLIDYTGYVLCEEDVTQVSPSDLALWGHETMWGGGPLGDPRVELTTKGWSMPMSQFILRGYGCPGTADELVCAVAYDPADVNTNTFTKIQVNGVWYWRPREPWGFGPQVACYLCKAYND